MKKLSWFIRGHLFLGFVFLYLPLLLLIIYSFNESRLVTVWTGFSTKWYGELLKDDELLRAAWLSIRVAFCTATGAVVLGTLAGIVMTRFSDNKGYTLFSVLVTAPLVMPEVITGLSLLLLFVALEKAIGFPDGRGMLTIWIAHVTLTTAYVTVITTSRLSELDECIEQAAINLGATPLKTFLQITVPMIAPALACGWLLAFTLSLDDLVIASFVSGAGSTTLPMAIYSSVRLGVSPKINALATIIITIVSALVAIATGIMMRLEKRRYS